MIPKISNYKEVILNDELPIINQNFTIFDQDILDKNYSYPYLETILNHENREEIFDYLNKNTTRFFISNGEIIGNSSKDKNIYYSLIKSNKVIAYVSLSNSNSIIDFDCIPKYQRQGYIFEILKFILKRRNKFHIEDNCDDNHILIKLMNNFYNNKIIDKELKDNILKIELIDKSKMLIYDDEHNMKTFLRQYSTKGIYSYTESYDSWFP